MSEPVTEPSSAPASPPDGGADVPTAGARRRRTGWRSFLTPGWVITAVVAVAFAYVAFTVLAPWQLGKNRDTNEFNDRLSAGLEQDPVSAADVLPADGSSAGEESEWTRVEMQGRFLVDEEVLLRNRPVDGRPAYHALTPFRMDDGTTVLVNRGWDRPVDGSAAPDVPAATSTPVTVTGYVRMSEAVPGNDPMTADGRLQVYGMSTSMVGDTVGLDLAADYVQLDDTSVAIADPSGTMSALELPNLDSGPYLSYGLQWIAFGVMVPLGLAYFVWAEIRERRRRRAEVAAETAASAAPATETATQTQTQTQTQTAPERPTSSSSRASKLENRYGGSRTRFYDKRNARDQERF
ncbi:SURF1 family cytochrome oxidase biogenesis protein [Corynebacterium sp. AOP40-9SA-29]|uniref:SURF1 family cytochrome oxidase biogenesis protein n=1 Tax=Corynebacterium sp. AOP40-9SA-29 TaxID=3457677 RepID=UPI00403485E5